LASPNRIRRSTRHRANLFEIDCRVIHYAKVHGTKLLRPTQLLAQLSICYVFDAASKSVASIPSPGAEVSKQALSFTEQNIKAALDHARKLAQATDFNKQCKSNPNF